MISTRGRYALRMMLDLAEHAGDGYVSLKDIAARQGISKKYLEQIILLLNREDLLKTTRGVQGGYRLAREPAEYTLTDILSLTEGEQTSVTCLGHNAPGCPREAICLTKPIWAELDRIIRTYMDSVTLQDILDRKLPPSGEVAAP